MPEFIPILTGGDAHNITAQVVVTDEAGIRKLTYRDKFAVELGSEEFNCETSVIGNVGTIPLYRLPFFVEVTTCLDATFTSMPLFETPTRDVPNPGVPLPCSPLFCPPNALCDEAQSRANRERSIINEMCPQFRLLKHDRDKQRDLMILYYASAAALAIAGALIITVGGIYGLVVGIILLVAAGILLGLAIAATITFNQTNGEFLAMERRMNDALNRFNSAANDARTHCCPHCITVDLSAPTC
ncbi:MAG: hypothetical protein WBP31_11325 [Chitinophagales bacterium]|jgi:hypothetical protein|nr:hypothetical protein [Bacteroidota bacterium]MBP8250313.1 hypothetical protein [Chitinophagales bacterium]MBK9506602.1 hypothetical protein [Bacteroidota bacterium]MBK9554226.1 hypothetical protein [Bacteroidota bacterium]MBL0280165.1 hypothetical protein [Bacteroidota bacterium]